MDLPAEVRIQSELLGTKGTNGTLVTVHSDGIYETICVLGGRRHRVLLPIAATVLIFREPEPDYEPGVEIER